MYRRMGCVGLFALLAVAATAPARARDASQADLHLGQHAEPEIKPGQEIFPTCTRCHGSDGIGSPDGSAPAIAGQYARVIISELVDFRPRYANRNDPRMERIASLHLLSQPNDIAEIAYFVSTLPRRPVPATGRGDGLSQGKALYQARCAGCHGTSAQGSERRGIPWLNSQHYDYLRREMLYTTEHRRPNMEKAHAALFQNLHQQDIDDLADYLSRLPPK